MLVARLKPMSESQNIHVVLAGGGTAGHVNPLLSIAKQIQKLEPTASISVIGTEVGLEARLVPQAGFEMDTIEKVPFPRTVNADLFTFPVRWTAQRRTVREILKKRQADVVVGVGGYAAAPAYSEAHKAGIPLAIHEQNASAGMANKMGARYADYVGAVYDNTGLAVGKNGVIERIGLPLRDAISNMASALEHNPQETKHKAALRLGLDPSRPIILITGGSLGAESVNIAMSNAAEALLKHAQVVHLTGKGKSQQVRTMVAAAVGAQHIADLKVCETDEEAVDFIAPLPGTADYHISEYLEHMELAMAAADVVVCRSGAGTVAEISALGVPAIYVPLAIGNGEQRFNAIPVVDAGGALMVDNSDFTSDWVTRHIPQILSDADGLEKMRKMAWNYGIRDAATVMAQRVLELARR